MKKIRLIFHINKAPSNKYEIKALGSKDLDVTNEDAVMKYILEEKPDYVIHAAGIPNQQFCIDNSEKARAVNVDGALYTAKACKKVGAKMVFTSTEQLFDGSEEEGPYNIGLFVLHGFSDCRKEVAP